MSLDLTASDPQNAQVIISGTVNGVNFACPTGNTTCSIPLSDGQGNITYRVNSSTGLSDSDSTTYKKDSTTPQINGSVSGASGLNNWYTSETTLSATSTDSTSGISTFEVNVNNTGWVSYAETTFNDGIHTIQYRATDNAGNVTETAVQEIKVDTITPIINISTTGTLGLNNWYVSNLTMNASSSDITSGISAFEMNVDNTSWVNYAETTLIDGIYTIQYRATDNAGNTYTTTQQEIKVDTTTPSLSLSTTGTRGQNDWYTSQTSVTPTSIDSGSGVVSIEYKLNNESFNLYTSPLQFIDGIHTYQFKITDNAGNITTTPSLTLKVDTIAPVVDMDDEINLGDKLYYELQDNGSGLWINRTVIEDEDEKFKKVVWLEEISGYKVESDILWDGKFKDGTTAPVGEYFITLKIADQAGNETFRTTAVTINPLSFLLPITPFIPPTTNTEITSNELLSDEQEQSFGNEHNGNLSTETSSTNVGGETIFANAIAQAGILTSFTSGNENTSTPITNTDILWGAMATAVLGATLAEWQRKREEEQARQREADRIAQMEKNAERKAEQARLDYLNAAYQAKLDREKAKQNAVASARWNGIAKIEEAKQEAKKIASQNTFNHLMNEHKDQKSVYVSKVNAGGSKPLYAPAKQDPNPPIWLNNLTSFTNEHLIQPIKNNIITPTINLLNESLVKPAKNIFINPVINVYEQAKTTVQNIATNVTERIEGAKTWATSYYNSLPPSFSDKLYLIARDTAIYTVTNAAEWLHQNVYVPVTNYAVSHPDVAEKATDLINNVLNIVRPNFLDKVVDTNPQTMSWVDLGMTWLFELGDQEKIVFDSNSRLTQDIVKLAFIENVKQAAIDKITDGNLENVKDECISSDTPQGQYPICKTNNFGVVEFLRSLSLDKIMQGDLSEEYLGSYKITINVEPIGDDKYIFHYQIDNSSTWDSATRFRLDNDGNGSNDGIIPDTSEREIGIELGGKLDQSFEWSEEVTIPTGN